MGLARTPILYSVIPANVKPLRGKNIGGYGDWWRAPAVGPEEENGAMAEITEDDVLIRIGGWEIRKRKTRRRRRGGRARERWALVALILALLVAWLIAPDVVQAVLTLLGR